MKRSLVVIILFLGVLHVLGSDRTTAGARFTFGGRIDLMTFYDSYQLVESRGGVQFYAPSRPMINDLGEDLGFQNRLRMSVAPTRLWGRVEVPDLLKAVGVGYLEIDFMGNGNTMINMPRVRHAYFELQWPKQSLLFGQTSHLAQIDDVAAGTVTFGGGWPFNPLSRPIQIRFTQKIADCVNFSTSLAMFSGANGDAQSYAAVPDVHARFLFGRNVGLSAGVVGGATLFKPRDVTADNTKATKQLLCWDAAAFIRYARKGHSITVFGMVGTNLSRFEMLGGYAPLLSDRNNNIANYGYCATGTLSLWTDYQSASWKGWQVGIFAGLQQNLGTDQEIMPAEAVVTPAAHLDYFWRVAPRLTYTYKTLSFGLEYAYTQASWAQNIDNYYKPITTFDNNADNRITLLARFKF